MKHKLKNFVIMNLGILLTTVGVYFFKIPNGFSTGGVSGIAVVLSGAAGQYLPDLAQYFTSANILTVINVLLLIVGFIFLGKGFRSKPCIAACCFHLVRLSWSTFGPCPSLLPTSRFWSWYTRSC